ncbi:MAG: cation:proton antiporter [Rhodospirillales bacterium]|nr:cation:proton antiporter [Rhodospirillales bacterium]MCB9996193.1 cation:proton antiporter [Rhodospirillales bacterium]
MIEIVQASLFYQLATLLLLASLLGFIALKLKQPLLVAFIALGLLTGPGALGLVDHGDHFIETLAELGITLLLFMVGLKLDIGLIRRLGPAAMTAGLAQVILTALLGGGLLLLMGNGLMTAILGGIALSFSSTIIVVKLLSDKRAIDSLYGKMALGILIVQDIAVIMAMVTLAALGGNESGLASYLMIAVKIAILAAGTGLFIRFIATPLTHSLSRAPELMMIIAIGLAAVMAAFCHYLGLSKELGGLLAGIALASTPAHNAIAARLAPLRDFLLLFFFVDLGARIHLGSFASQILPALGLSAFVLIAKPALIMMVMNVTGYRKRTGFMTGISLSQISEFSLIFMAMAAGMELVQPETAALFTLTALITIAVSCYAITYNTQLHEMLERHIRLRDRKIIKYPEESESYPLENKYDVVVVGLGRYGSAMARQFGDKGYTVLGVDFDPGAIKQTVAAGIHAIYGDAADPEIVAQLPLDKTKIVVFAFHHYMSGPLVTDLRHTLASILRQQGYKGHIAATAHHPDSQFNLEAYGIDIILKPFEDAALHGADHILSIIEKETPPG